MQKSEIFDLQKLSSWLDFNSNGRPKCLLPLGMLSSGSLGSQSFTWCRCGASVQRRNLAEFNLPPFKRQPHQNKKMLNAWKNVCAVRGKRVVHWMLKSNLIMWNLDKPFSACRVQFSSVAQSGSALCNPMDYSTPGLAVHHQLLEFTQTHAHWVGGAIQPFCLPKDPDSPALPQWL